MQRCLASWRTRRPHPPSLRRASRPTSAPTTRPSIARRLAPSVPKARSFVEADVEERAAAAAEQPLLWPWLLALLVLVLGGLGALLVLHAGRRRRRPRPRRRPLLPRRRRRVCVCRTSSGRRPRRRRRRCGTPASRSTSSPCRPTRPSRHRSSRRIRGRERGDGGIDRAAERGAEAADDHAATTDRRPDDDRAATDDERRAARPATGPDVVGELARRRGAGVRRRGAEGRRRLRAVDEPQGSVVAQAQPPGTRARAGGHRAGERLRTAPTRAADAQVPDVVGLERRRRAARRLGDAGFEVLAIERRTSASTGRRALPVARRRRQHPARLARAPLRRRLTTVRSGHVRSWPRRRRTVGPGARATSGRGRACSRRRSASG